MHYKAIIFDLDNTLLNFELCERQAILGALERCSISLNGVSKAAFLETFEIFNAKYWQLRHQLSPNQLIEKSYFDTLQELGIIVDDYSCLGQGYWHIFNNSGELEQGAKETLNVLSNHYRLTVVTNGLAAAQHSRLKAADLERYFEFVVISELVGYEKPAPEIFNHALSKLNLTPDLVLYVGDSLKYDYAGATRAGIDFCYYNRKGQNMPEDVRPKFVVKKLGDLLQILV